MAPIDGTLAQLVDTLFEQHVRLRAQEQDLVRLAGENAALRQQLADLSAAYELSQQAATRPRRLHRAKANGVVASA